MAKTRQDNCMLHKIVPESHTNAPGILTGESSPGGLSRSAFTGGFLPEKRKFRSLRRFRALFPVSPAMEKPILESGMLEKIMPESPTMEQALRETPTIKKIMTGSPTMEECMTDCPCRDVPR